MSRKNSLILAAAFTGLLGGTMGRLNASPFNPNPAGAQSDTAQPQEKHACAGKGGCATDGSQKNKANVKKATEKHACSGKNSCKGKGGCATDGSVKNASQKQS